jgi:hypothetical protein
VGGGEGRLASGLFPPPRPRGFPAPWTLDTAPRGRPVALDFPSQFEPPIIGAPPRPSAVGGAQKSLPSVYTIGVCPSGPEPGRLDGRYHRAEAAHSIQERLEARSGGDASSRACQEKSASIEISANRNSAIFRKHNPSSGCKMGVIESALTEDHSALDHRLKRGRRGGLAGAFT